MKIKELKDYLLQNSLDPDILRIEREGIGDNQYSVKNDNDEWYISFWERGIERRLNGKTFLDEKSACKSLILDEFPNTALNSLRSWDELIKRLDQIA